MNESLKWDYRFLELALLVSTWSKDPGSKVGAVIVDAERRVVSTGYNGFPRGVSDEGINSMGRDEKLRRTIHAEENAVMFARGPLASCTVYVTHVPCGRCAAKLIQCGIKRIIVACQSEEFLLRWAEDITSTRALCRQAGVQLEIMEE